MSGVEAIIIIFYLACILVDLEYIYKAKALIECHRNYMQGSMIFIVGIIGMLMNWNFIEFNISLVTGSFANLIYWFISDMLVIKVEAVNN